MIVNVHIPALGANMEKATITGWKAGEGEQVQEGAIIATIETDKASYDITAPGSGFLRLIRREGEEVPVGGIIGIIASTREEYEASPFAPSPSRHGEELTPLIQKTRITPPGVPLSPSSIRISAIARKMAEDHGIDLSTLQGTGPGGRITKEDVEHAISKTPGKPLSAPEIHPAGRGVEQVIPLSGKQKTMAQRLTESLRVMAQMTNWEYVDMSQLVRLKETGILKGEIADISYTDIFVKFTGIALQEHPLLNAYLENDQIHIWKNINIGVAVAAGEEGDELVVPVIRNVEKKSIREISQELGVLIRKARENKLSIEELSGGTISLTNIGALGADPGTPIIQLPHAAIVGFGAIEKKPTVVEDSIVIRPIMLLAVTVDHRFITGAVSARFRKRLKNLLENPLQLIVDFV